MEVANYSSPMLVLIGTVLVVVGYFIPRNYNIDPKLSARENERRSFDVARQARAMDMCIIAGTVFIGLGGSIVLGLLIRDLYVEKTSSSSQTAAPMQPYYGTNGGAPAEGRRTSVTKRNSVRREAPDSSK